MVIIDGIMDIPKQTDFKIFEKANVSRHDVFACITAFQYFAQVLKQTSNAALENNISLEEKVKKNNVLKFFIRN